MVAWEEQLRARSRPEWKDKYVDYTRLKRKLSELEDKRRDAIAGIGKGFTVSLTEFRQSFTMFEMDLEGAKKSSLLQPLRTASGSDNGGEEEETKDDELDRLAQELMDDILSELERVSMWYNGTVTKLEDQTRAIVQASEDNTFSLAGGSLADSETIFELFSEAVDLAEFVHINAEALRKIVKKLDKNLGTYHQKDFVKNRLKESELATKDKPDKPCDGERARACRRALEELLSADVLKEMRARVMENALERTSVEGKRRKLHLKVRRFLASVLCSLLSGLLAFVLMVEEKHARARRSIVLLMLIVPMWVLEAAPFEATALLVPPIGVLLDILEGSRQEQAQKLIGAVFTDSLYLVLCGFVISSIFSRCQLDCAAAVFLQRNLGHRPYAFMLAIMFLGVGLSALVSNVTAPVILLEVLRPCLCELPADLAYSKALLLGLAFACNIGGMMTPISSPQNVASLQTLRGAGSYIRWAEWLAVSVPFCIIAVIAAWAIILVVIAHPFGTDKDKKVSSIPVVTFEHKEVDTFDKVALLSALLALVGFAYQPVAAVLGGTPMVALLFVAVSLATGSVTRETFNGYKWHLLFLIGGGNALGLAVRESGLLDIVTHLAKHGFSSNPPILVAQLIGVLVGATTFVSHTVAALVLMPLVVKLGSAAGVMRLSVLLGALACSTACALPMTSFPNVNSLNAVNYEGKAWLRMKHFLAAGIPTTVCITTLLCTVGYLLGVLVIGS